MRVWFALLAFLALGTHGIIRVENARVTDVHRGLVTLKSESGVYQIDAEEPWRIGDRAEVIVGEELMEVRFAK